MCYHQMLSGRGFISLVVTAKRRKNTLRVGLSRANHYANSVKHRASKRGLMLVHLLATVFLNFDWRLWTFRGENAKAPEFFEDLFCNLSCYEEYRFRTSNRFLRQVSP